MLAEATAKANLSNCGFCDDTGRVFKNNWLLNVFGKTYTVTLEHGERGYNIIGKACLDCSKGRQLLLNWRAGHRDCPTACSLGVISDATRQEELGTFCPVCEEGAAFSRILDDRASEIRRKLIAERIANSRIAENLKDKTFENFYTDIHQVEIELDDGAFAQLSLVTPEEIGELMKAKSIVYQAFQSRQSVAMCGKTGVGKSHLAAAYMNAAIAEGELGIFASFVGLMDGLYRTLNPVRGSGSDGYQEHLSWNEVLSDYLVVDVLVLDDLGQEKTTDKSMEVLFYILNRRMNEKKPTIVTTNYSLDELMTKRGYTPAVRSRLKAMRQVEWNVADWREKSGAITEYEVYGQQ
jgi:DNA replication protein DnaC